jgi:hypothetical protein
MKLYVKVRRGIILDPDEFMKKHKYSQKNSDDYSAYEKKLKPPQGKYRLVSLIRGDIMALAIESVFGDFDSVEEAEKEAYQMKLEKTMKFAIYNDASTIVKSFERVKWTK